MIHLSDFVLVCAVAEEMMNHPMFKNEATAGAGGNRPSLDELGQMKESKFITVKAADVQDPNW